LRIEQPTAYPIAYDVSYPERLGRLSTAFRLILAIPQMLIVGGPGIGYGANSQTGLFGAVVAITSMLSWFAIMFTKRYPRGLWDMAMMYMRWRANVVTYTALLRDEYPPFGEGSYPVTFEVEYPEQSDRWTVGLRLILVIPHLVVLFFVMLVWLATAVIAWFAILFTGRYPKGLFLFGVGAMRWSMRVQAYLYLMRDEYPPFSLSE
jgi:hypothetical protein